jgi:predicted N-acetyltransferase YhbS
MQLVPNLVIVDLGTMPQLLEVVADRIWRRWSKNRGYDLQFVIDKLQDIAFSDSEFTLVGHMSGHFVGSISLLNRDLHARPHLSPWIAAVWVEPEYRKNKVGARLVSAAEDVAFAAGHSKLYLACSAELRPFYAALGWSEIEANVGEDRSYVLAKSR